MIEVSIDFETRSVCDLKVEGLANYARHPTTEALCLAYKIGDGPVRRWKKGEPLPADLRGHVKAGGVVNAWNVTFEIEIWNNVMAARHGWPVLEPAQCRCTMARCYAMAMPGSLEKAAPAAGIAEAKDAAGQRLMLMLCRPKDFASDGSPIWWGDEEKLERLGAYCEQDVVTEHVLGQRLLQLSPAEQKVWQVDYAVNQRGVYVDRKAVEAAIRIVEVEQDRLNKEMRRVTGNFVGFCTEVGRLGEWIKTQGVVMDGVAKAEVLNALTDASLPPRVRDALYLRQQAGKTSTAKLRAMVDAASRDGRLRGMAQYHGAGTGRWAGRRVQLQNLPRSKFGAETAEAAIDLICREPDPRQAAEYLDALYGSPLDVISSCLRGMLTAAPGHELLAADFANIEGRGLAWLAGEEWKLEAFRAYDAGAGPDIYKLAYASSFGIDVGAVTKDQRQIGKVEELALGYGGGVGAFQTMARGYGVKVDDTQADSIKLAWRGTHPKIVRYWGQLDEASMAAVLNPGKTYAAGPVARQVKFRVKGSFLWCLLPSGRMLCYPYPKVKPKETPWGEMRDAVHYMHVNGMTNKWEETHTYGGKLAENVTQAICRDLLANALLNCEAGGYPVVMHVHDEVVSEVPIGHGGLAEFEKLCSTMPAWADGLPVVAAGWRGKRYRK